MIRSDIRSLSAYHVPESSGLIKLDAMENPFAMPAELQEKWLEILAGVEINRYPDADMLALREKIAGHAGVAADQVLVGNGSDEIIQMLLMAVTPGACVVPEPTFVMYEVISRWLKRPVAAVPLGKDFSLDATKLLQVCAREKAAAVFLACPNNPTGNLWPEDTIRKIADNFNGMLVIDEAYGPFSERTHTHLISGHVLVLRTFSKLGWAGLRLGYLLGEAELIAELNKVRMPYNINALTQASAMFLLDHFDLFEGQCAKIRTERERMTAALASIAGFEVFASQANFLLVRLSGAQDVFEKLRAAGILVKSMHGHGGLLMDCLRITIGTKEENNAVLAALEEIVK